MYFKDSDNSVVGIQSADGEYVDLSNTVYCDGPVESWFKRIGKFV